MSLRGAGGDEAISIDWCESEQPKTSSVSGEIFTSHVRSIDTLARPIRYAGAAVPTATLDDVRSKLAALIGL
jgi:mRNA interferase MazF